MTIGPTRHDALYSASEDRRRVGAKSTPLFGTDAMRPITGITAEDFAHSRRQHDGDHSPIRVRTTFHSSKERDSGCRPAKAPPNIALDQASRTVTPSR